MTEIPMRPLLHLTVVALAGALGTAALAASAWSAGTALASVPVAWWSTSQIAQIAIVLACGIGAAGCLWHLASAGLALAILLQDAVAITSQASTTSRTSRGASARTVMGGRADVVLQRWGAPLVRRITTGALIAGFAISPVATAAFTNSYVRDTGTFSVSKSVKGDYTPQAGETVKVGYTCNDPDSTKGTLDVPMDGTAVNSPTLPTGTACTLNEDNTSAQREGYALATTYSTTTATIAKDQVPNVSVTNTYTRQTGGFSVSKTVQGDGAKLAPAEFTFEYTCTDKVTGKAASPKQLVVKTGQTAHVNDLPTGSCTLTEKDAPVKATSLSTTLTVNGTPAQEGKATFDVLGGDNPAVNISATNTYTLDRSTFQVTKTVAGAQAGDKEFTFTYTCTDGTEGTLKAKANGEAVSGPKVPTGTQCTVTEDAKTAAIDGYTLAAPEAQTVTVSEKDQVVNTSFTNTYTAVADTPSPSATPKPSASGKATPSGAASSDPTPSGSAPSNPTPSGSAPSESTPSGSAPSAPAQDGSGSPLARTGAYVGIPLALALAAIAGGVLLAYRRRA